MTTLMPLARYSTINGALASGSKPPSYTTSWDMTTCAEERLEETTIERYKAAIEYYLYPYFGNTRLTKITIAMVSEFKSHLLKTPYPSDYVVERLREKIPSTDAIRRSVVALGALLADAQLRGRLERI